MEKKVTGLIGEVRKTRHGAMKKANVLKLYKYLFIKIFASISTMIILLLTLAFSIIAPIVFFSMATDVYGVISSIQFFVLLFYCIFIFLFILLISIRLFGNQIEDNTFLLILTKPFSRGVIILTQYMVIIFSTLIVVIAMLVIEMIIGDAMIGIDGLSLANFYNKMIMKLFLFMLVFCFLLINGVVLMASLFTSRTVFLVFSIFCSLFILGGLPFTLYTYKLDNLIFNLGSNKETYQQVEKSVYYKNFLDQGLIKYPDFSKSMFDYFYNWKYDDIQSYNYKQQQGARIGYFDGKGIINDDPAPVVIDNVQITSWYNRQIIQRTTGTIHLLPVQTFLSRDQIESKITKEMADKTDPSIIAFQRDLIKIYDDYLKVNNNNLASYIESQYSKANELMQFESVNDIEQPSVNKPNNASYYEFVDDNDGKTKYVPFTNDELIQAYQNKTNYNIGDKRDEYSKVFMNPMFYVVRSMEDSIFSIVETLKIMENEMLAMNDAGFKNYESIINQYSWINKINVFEHFNQLWTWMLGYYGEFAFDPNFVGQIDFHKQMNSFFSYPMDRFEKVDNKISYKNLSYVQNNVAIIIAYIVLGCIFCGATSVVWKFKKIS